MTQKMTDLVKQVVAILMALFMFLGTIGYSFEAFNPESIEAFGIILAALIPLGVTVYGIYMNTFVAKTAFDKAQMKEAQRQQEEGYFDPSRVIEVEVEEDIEDGADIK